MTVAPIIACISANQAAPRILHAAKALADSLQASRQPVHVGSPTGARQTRAAAERLLEALAIAASFSVRGIRVLVTEKRDNHLTDLNAAFRP